jgi:hypothetical protein
MLPSFGLIYNTASTENTVGWLHFQRILRLAGTGKEVHLSVAFQDQILNKKIRYFFHLPVIDSTE